VICTWIYIVTIITGSDWGFFGHRLINRVAVYTVPTEMMAWYKPHIDFLAEHAVDPDKRRYASKHEAVRHYIDLDEWGELPFDHIPRKWDEVLALNLELYTVAGNDTSYLMHAYPHQQWKDSLPDYNARLYLVRNFYLKQYYRDQATISLDSLKVHFPNIDYKGSSTIYMGDYFSQYGIVPYHLQSMLFKLTKAFQDNNLNKVLRTSAEFGHYIADASVPLHTTSNYNGQLTNQLGIHAFWESRIPELFALDEFDMIVGPATYIHDPEKYFWDIVLSSHRQVASVLGLEKELSETYPSDQQFCFNNRLNKVTRTQCESYARAYNQAMDNMVEDRFRVAVKAVGDVWYTAWVDAGQPIAPGQKVLSQSSDEDDELNRAIQSGRTLGRDHGK
jgi:hypothetical protein